MPRWGKEHPWVKYSEISAKESETNIHTFKLIRVKKGAAKTLPNREIREKLNPVPLSPGEARALLTKFKDKAEKMPERNRPAVLSDGSLLMNDPGPFLSFWIRYWHYRAEEG